MLVSTAYADHEPATVTKEDLAARYLGLTPANIHDGPIGLYEVAVNMGVSYVTKDGRYLIRGEIIDLSTQQNLTAASLDSQRAELLAQIDPAGEIVFSPEGEVKHRIFVFTDVDCGYCRQFHREIAQVNALGIEVRYVSYPRTGPNTESWAKAEGVWCAADRRTALTEAKRGAAVPAVADCASNPVADQYNVGVKIGLRGTPGVITDTGVDLGGYYPPAELEKRLDQIAAANGAAPQPAAQGSQPSQNP